MLWQWIIVGLIIALAGWGVVRSFAAEIGGGGCGSGCGAGGPETPRAKKTPLVQVGLRVGATPDKAHQPKPPSLTESHV